MKISSTASAFLATAMFAPPEAAKALIAPKPKPIVAHASSTASSSKCESCFRLSPASYAKESDTVGSVCAAIQGPGSVKLSYHMDEPWVLTGGHVSHAILFWLSRWMTLLL